MKFHSKVISCKLFLLLIFLSHTAESKTFEFKFASFVYHLYDLKDSKNEYFKNNYLSLGISFSENSQFLLGTFKNSQDNRCFVTGIEHTWKKFDNDWSFHGAYLYAGEFFFDSFSKCGDGGFYADMKEKTDLAFSPYIHHYFQYSVTKNLSFDIGILLPAVFVTNLSLHF